MMQIEIRVISFHLDHAAALTYITEKVCELFIMPIFSMTQPL